jgi:hypothetical protein
MDLFKMARTCSPDKASVKGALGLCLFSAKQAKFKPLQIAGEIIFGTMGEYWEKKRMNKGVGA